MRFRVDWITTEGLDGSVKLAGLREAAAAFEEVRGRAGIRAVDFYRVPAGEHRELVPIDHWCTECRGSGDHDDDDES